MTKRDARLPLESSAECKSGPGAWRWRESRRPMDSHCRTAHSPATALHSAMRAFSLMILAALLGPIVARAADDTRWHQPLDGDQLMTSTFGEHRMGHFHSGIDLSTGQRVGVPVRAVDDGEVIRLRASAFGYGRAIYLRTRSGLVAVYAHLLRFAPRIEVLLRERQEATGEYEADLHMTQGLPVARGELIAWSGDTGAGPPHFHFELRRGDEPSNPLLSGFDIPDPDPPQIRTLTLVALSPGGRIEGLPQKRVDLSRAKAISPISLWGEVGVVCQVLDRAGVGSGRLAPLEVRLFLRSADGERVLLGGRRFDEVSYSWTKEVARVYDATAPGEIPAIRLFAWPGTTPDPTWEAPSLGVIDAEKMLPGLHEILVEASDAAGHVSVVSVPFRAVPPSGWMTLLHLGDGSGRLSAEWHGPAEALPTRLLSRGPGGQVVEALLRGATPEGRWWTLDWPAEGPRPAKGWRLWDVGDGKQKTELQGERTRSSARGVWGPWDEAPRGSVSWEASPGGLLLWLSLEAPPVSTPRLRMLHDGGGRRRHLVRAGDGRWWTLISPEDIALLSGQPERSGASDSSQTWKDGASLELAWGAPGDAGMELPLESLALLRRERSGSWSIPGTSWSLAWNPGTVYGEGLLRAGVETGAEEEVLWPSSAPFPAASLPRVAPIVDVAPHELPLRNPLTLVVKKSTQLKDTDEGLGVYRKTLNGWRWVGGLAATGDGALQAPLDRLGTFTILRDTSPPWILDPRPPDGATSREPPTHLRVRIGDAGARFRAEDADLWLDGRSTLARYDPDASELILEMDDLPEPGRHAWEVRVTDRAGHSTRRSFSFLVEGP